MFVLCCGHLVKCVIDCSELIYHQIVLTLKDGVVRNFGPKLNKFRQSYFVVPQLYQISVTSTAQMCLNPYGYCTVRSYAK